MLHYLAIGTILGLSAGFAPGPLLTLVIAETLRHDVKSGIRVALAPIVTDLPIIMLTLFVLSGLSAFHSILGVISLAGGCFLLFMGWESMRAKNVETDCREIQPKSLAKGIMVNILSPHPYLFWLSIGAPVMTKAYRQHFSASLAFLISIYIFLVGAKIVLAIVTGKSKSFLKGRGYLYIMRFLGLVLWGLAMIFFRDGAELLGII